MPAPWHLAIDFGTSNTAAAHTSPINGEVTTLPLTHQGNLLPSAVFLEDSGALSVGLTALTHGALRPDAPPNHVYSEPRIEPAGAPLRENRASLSTNGPVD